MEDIARDRQHSDMRKLQLQSQTLALQALKVRLQKMRSEQQLRT
jgi:hypothetical protein